MIWILDLLDFQTVFTELTEFKVAVANMYFSAVVLVLILPVTAMILEDSVKSNLSDLLKYLSHIQLIWENNIEIDDFEEFFLKEQKVVSVFIGDGDFSENKIFITKFDDVDKALTKFVNLQCGTYINIIIDAIDKIHLEKYSMKIWSQKRILKLYYLTKFGLFYFNPFSKKLYSLENSDYNKILKNLFGFPLRNQMFRSVYSVPVFSENTGKIENIIGPDGKVAKELAKRMNFTMILKEPNQDFFG